MNVEGVSEVRGETPQPSLNLLYNLHFFIRFDLEGRLGLLKRAVCHWSWGKKGNKAVWAVRAVHSACIAYFLMCCSSYFPARVWPW